MKSFLLAMAMLALGSALDPAATNGPYRVEATAFALRGITRAGTRTHGGVVSADPTFLPLGTRIRVTGAGQFSGIYLSPIRARRSSAGTSTFTSRVEYWLSDLEGNWFLCRF